MGEHPMCIFDHRWMDRWTGKCTSCEDLHRMDRLRRERAQTRLDRLLGGFVLTTPSKSNHE